MSEPVDSAWLQTASGRKVFVMKLEPSDIAISDIAHALANLCRFNGHSSAFYSVAQHCIHVSHLVPPKLALAALLHDASEAYLCDIPRPLKMLPMFAEYRKLEAHIMRVIEQRYDLPPGITDAYEIKHADHRALCTEARDLIKNAAPGYWHEAPVDVSPIMPMLPFEAKRAFLNRIEELLVHSRQQSLF